MYMSKKSFVTVILVPILMHAHTHTHCFATSKLGRRHLFISRKAGRELSAGGGALAVAVIIFHDEGRRALCSAAAIAAAADAAFARVGGPAFRFAVGAVLVPRVGAHAPDCAAAVAVVVTTLTTAAAVTALFLLGSFVTLVANSSGGVGSAIAADCKDARALHDEVVSLDRRSPIAAAVAAAKPVADAGRPRGAHHSRRRVDMARRLAGQWLWFIRLLDHSR